MEIAFFAGDVLAGKYRVERVLGVGGMGIVIAATHLDLNETVAMKFLLPEAADQEESVLRFMREGRAAAKIRSEHVARVYDVGRLDDRGPYMVMEYLEGSNLRSVLKQGGPLPIGVAVEYVLQACEALAEAHAAGIIHRDLKPSNLFITFRADSSPCVKVLDFGISKMTLNQAEAELEMTKTATVLGSPLYMSPEQMACARDVDARTDLWGLGIILYELLTGTRAFQGGSMPEVCAKVLQSAPRPIAELRPDAPPGLAEVVLHCLEKQPAQRCASVAELARALAPFAPERARLSVGRILRVAQAMELDAPTEVEIPRRPATLDEREPPAESVRTDASGATHAGVSAASGIAVGEVTQSAAESSAVADEWKPRRRVSALAAVTAGLVLVTGAALVASTRHAAPPVPEAVASAEPVAAAPGPTVEPAPAPAASTEPSVAAETPAEAHSADTHAAETHTAEASTPRRTRTPRRTTPARSEAPPPARAAETASPGLFNTPKW